MTTRINLFTKKPYPSIMKDISYNVSLKFTSIDLPYFCILSFREKQQENPMTGDDFTDLFKVIEDKGWGVLPEVEKYESHQREYEFLERMGLACYEEDDDLTRHYYVNRLAYILYNPTYGLFQNFDPESPIEQQKELFAPLIKLFMTYILPGRWWRAFYGRQYLPDTIGYATMLNTEMLELEDEWLTLDDIIGMPSETKTPIDVANSPVPEENGTPLVEGNAEPDA
jgi:hypothetical protein